MNLADPIPRFTLTRLKQDDGALYFGPFASSGALRNTLTLVRRKFNLRGCRPLTPTDVDYKHCLYGNLKFCTAPCIGNVTREEYLAQVRAACDFLSGQSEEIQNQLEAEMKKAAAAQDYEKAAAIRDTFKSAAESIENAKERTAAVECINRERTILQEINELKRMSPNEPAARARDTPGS